MPADPSCPTHDPVFDPACPACVDAMLDEADRTHREYIALGVCDRCGATSLQEAETQCQPWQDPTGEYTCPGDDLWPQEREAADDC